MPGNGLLRRQADGDQGQQMAYAGLAGCGRKRVQLLLTSWESCLFAFLTLCFPLVVEWLAMLPFMVMGVCVCVEAEGPSKTGARAEIHLYLYFSNRASLPLSIRCRYLEQC